MRQLYWEASDYAIAIAEAERAYPLECCGLLVGTIERDCIRIYEVLPMENAWQGDTARDFESAFVGQATSKGAEMPTAERRYTIDSQAMLAVQKSARARSLAIVGVYHSHPNHAAIPSAYDCEFAWPDYVYPIISVRRGHPSELRAWQLDDNGQFVELAIVRERDRARSEPT